MSDDALLYHTIRHGNGAWQGFFGIIESVVSGGPAGFAAAGCAGVGDSLQVVGVGTDAQLYHTIRNPNGTWQNPFGAVASQVSGGPGGFYDVACTGLGGDLHVVALGSDGKLYFTIRYANGNWLNPFILVEGATSGGPAGFTSVGCAATGTDLQITGTGLDGVIYHTIHHANGTWQDYFGLVESEVSGGPARGFSQVSCCGVGTTLELVGVGNDGQLYHTIRNPNGTWQNYFGLIESQVLDGPAQFTNVGCAGVGTTLELVGVGNDGQLYHTIRNPNGTWQNYFGLIEGQVSGGPSRFTSVATGGVGTDLDVVGGTSSGGWL